MFEIARARNTNASGRRLQEVRGMSRDATSECVGQREREVKHVTLLETMPVRNKGLVTHVVTI